MTESLNNMLKLENYPKFKDAGMSYDDFSDLIEAISNNKEIPAEYRDIILKAMENEKFHLPEEINKNNANLEKIISCIKSMDDSHIDEIINHADLESSTCTDSPTSAEYKVRCLEYIHKLLSDIKMNQEENK